MEDKKPTSAAADAPKTPTAAPDSATPVAGAATPEAGTTPKLLSESAAATPAKSVDTAAPQPATQSQSMGEKLEQLETAALKPTATTSVTPTNDLPKVASAPVVPATTSPKPGQPLKEKLFIAFAGLLILFAIGAVWLRLEREERVNTGVFDGYFAAQQAAAPVAFVNGEELIGADLELSLEQLEQSAMAQGLNPTNPDLQSEIRDRAVEMLVNTTLLQQAAEDQGVVITDEAVAERIAELEQEAGGVEELAERMAEFAIDRETFEEDVRVELTIVTLLEEVFAEADLSVTDEEVVAVYEQAGGLSPDAPPLDIVRPQIEAQIRQSKEQVAVDEYLDQLRAAADIEIVS